MGMINATLCTQLSRNDKWPHDIAKIYHIYLFLFLDGGHYMKLILSDIDECLFELMCVAPKICKNTLGSFICEGNDVPTCPPGFHFKTATQSCTGNNNPYKVLH